MKEWIWCARSAKRSKVVLSPRVVLLILLAPFLLVSECLGIESIIKDKQMIETRKCSEKLSDVINMIDGVITKIPNGPVKDINQILESYLPIIGCEKEEFEIIVRKSRNFKYLYHEVPYVVAEFQYGSVVVGLPFWIEEKKISDGYAKVKK